jgi:hypothetical protein
MSTPRRLLSLRKGEHTYLFRYAEGQEVAVLQALVRYAERADQPLDWFDATVLSYQMGCSLQGKLHPSR